MISFSPLSVYLAAFLSAHLPASLSIYACQLVTHLFYDDLDDLDDEDEDDYTLAPMPGHLHHTIVLFVFISFC